MEQFDLSQSNIGDNSINTSTISTVDKSFMKKINKFQRELNPNQKNFPETIYEEDWEERPIHPSNSDIYIKADGNIPFQNPSKRNYNNNNN